MLNMLYVCLVHSSTYTYHNVEYATVNLKLIRYLITYYSLHVGVLVYVRLVLACVRLHIVGKVFMPTRLYAYTCNCIKATRNTYTLLQTGN